MGKNIDLTGAQFGRLRVIKKQASVGHNSTWFCICECGRSKRVRADLLSRGIVESCGCYAKEVAADLLRTHGMSGTPEYVIWAAMIQRCHNPNSAQYGKYGANGIRVCERWKKSFENFFADMGRRPTAKHSIDCKNGKGPYSPSNCRWATSGMQNRNISTNRLIEIDEVSFCVADWCRLMDVSPHRPYDMVYYNKRSGINTVEEAIRKLYVEWNARHL